MSVSDNRSFFFAQLSHHDHMFTGRLKKKNRISISAPWWHFRELQACCCARWVPVYPVHYRQCEEQGGKQNSGNALYLTFQNETATFHQQRTCMPTCYSPGLVFLFPSTWLQSFFGCLLPRGCGHVSVYTVHVINTWHTDMEHWSVWNIYLYTLCHTGAFCWSFCCLSVGDKDKIVLIIYPSAWACCPDKISTMTNKTRKFYHLGWMWTSVAVRQWSRILF